MLINKNRFKSKRGSAITAVVIFTLLVVIVVSSIIGLSLHEKNTLEKNQILNEAKYAAESMGEFVAAQIVAEYSRVNGEGVLTPDITVPDRVISFFKPDFMRVRDKTFSSGNVAERLGVYVSPKYDIVLDSNNPFYENDLDAKEGGAEVKAYDVVIYTHVTNEKNNEETDFYLEQLFQVRENPLTTGIIFYNQNLALTAAVWDSVGDIHVNGDMTVSSGLDAYVSGQITLSGGIYHAGAKKKILGQAPNQDRAWNGNIFFDDADGNPLGMWIGPSGMLARDNSTGYPEGQARAGIGTAAETTALNAIDDQSNWLDSRNSNWTSLSKERWGNTINTGLSKKNPLAIPDYIPQSASANGTRGNYGYAIIEPMLPSSHPGRKSKVVRSQKVAAKAGIIFKVDDTNNEIKAYIYPKVDGLNNPDATPTEITIPDGVIGKANTNLNQIEESGKIERYSYNSGSNKVERGIYDRLEQRSDAGPAHDYTEGIDLVTIDISKFKDAIETAKTDSSNWGSDFDFSRDWNGVVYFEFPVVDDIPNNRKYLTDDNGNRIKDSSGNDIIGDLAVPAANNRLALQIINGEELPKFSDPNDPQGLTLATNAPMYVKGNFNANGQTQGQFDIKKNNNDAPDPNEIPAALVADTVTLLSSAWDNESRSYSHLPMDRNNTAGQARFGAPIEVAAAIMTGAPGGDANRGVQNVIRLLEHGHQSVSGSPQNKELFLRGSLIRLFDSEVYTTEHEFSDFSNNSGPYKRTWQHSPLFKDGEHPPGLPQILTFRKIRQRSITETQFQDAMSFIDQDKDPRGQVWANDSTQDRSAHSAHELGHGAKPLENFDFGGSSGNP